MRTLVGVIVYLPAKTSKARYFIVGEIEPGEPFEATAVVERAVMEGREALVSLTAEERCDLGFDLKKLTKAFADRAQKQMEALNAIGRLPEVDRVSAGPADLGSDPGGVPF